MHQPTICQLREIPFQCQLGHLLDALLMIWGARLDATAFPDLMTFREYSQSAGQLAYESQRPLEFLLHS